jgi:predicted SprT family Zn-dependent metalloprotease
MNKVWSLEDVRKVLIEAGRKTGFQCEDVPVVISTRMEKTMGSFYFKMRGETMEPHSFRFSSKLLDGTYEREVVTQVILHEYAHYYVNMRDQKNHNHDEVFKEACRDLGISDYTYFKELVELKPKKGYLLLCGTCGKTLGKRRRSDAVQNIVKTKVSSCCHAKIKIKAAVF